jgi:very-short-patch-repair endonuclease
VVHTVSCVARSARNEAYVIDLCDEILGERALRQHRFQWLQGDLGRDGRTRTLPVDAYFPEHKLVIEYRERQHDEPVPFFDRRQTVSGVTRGAQRRLYDERRDVEIPRHGLKLIVIRPHDLVCD